MLESRDCVEKNARCDERDLFVVRVGRRDDASVERDEETRVEHEAVVERDERDEAQNPVEHE